MAATWTTSSTVFAQTIYTAKPSALRSSSAPTNAASQMQTSVATRPDRSHPDRWPDVPLDQNCAAGTDCENTDLHTIKASPTFWSRKRLTSVTTQILNPNASSTYLDVDSWTLAHILGAGRLRP